MELPVKKNSSNSAQCSIFGEPFMLIGDYESL
jgi:hypothetical protein